VAGWSGQQGIAAIVDSCMQKQAATGPANRTAVAKTRTENRVMLDMPAR
jgi:hypothetical protein